MTGSHPHIISISVVVPVYRGEKTLDLLVSELAATVVAWEARVLPLALSEAIFVNDGADDDSARVLERLRLRHDWLRVLSLPCNIGQHAATMAGLRASNGDWVATLDEDLQHRPTHLLAMLATATGEGLDLIYAKPAEAVHQSPFRDGSSRITKLALAALTGNPRISDFNSFRLIRGEVARAAAGSDSRPYLDVTLCACTERSGTCTIPMKDRRYIEQQSSGWTPRALVAHARRMLVSSNSPRARAIAVGTLLPTIAIAVITMNALRQDWLADHRVGGPGRAIYFLGLLCIFGITLILLGLLLDYLISNWRFSRRFPTLVTIDRSKDALLLSHLKQWEMSQNPAKA